MVIRVRSNSHPLMASKMPDQSTAMPVCPADYFRTPPAEYFETASSRSQQALRKFSNVRVNPRLCLPSANTPSRPRPVRKTFECEETGCSKVYKSFAGLKYHMEKIHNLPATRELANAPCPLWSTISLSDMGPKPHSSVSIDPSSSTALPSPEAPADPFRFVFTQHPLQESLLLTRCPSCDILISAPGLAAHLYACPSGPNADPPTRKSPTIQMPAPPPIADGPASCVSSTSPFDDGSMSPLSWRERAQLRQLLVTDVCAMPDTRPARETRPARGRTRILFHQSAS